MLLETMNEQADFTLSKCPEGGWSAFLVSIRAKHWIKACHPDMLDDSTQSFHLTLREANAFLREARQFGLLVLYHGPQGVVRF